MGARYNCGNCDNCLFPPATWDATEAARKALSCIYRFTQHGGPRSFGSGHLIDVLRGKASDKVAQHGHQRLSTFGIGADLSEQQWRSVLRQLIALGHLAAVGEYNTLSLTESARSVLKGQVTMLLRVASETRGRLKASRATRGVAKVPTVELDAIELQRYAALREWRAEVAKQNNLPAYVVFHDATLVEFARRVPKGLAALSEISGVGARKLEAYGHDILRVLEGAASPAG